MALVEVHSLALSPGNERLVSEIDFTLQAGQVIGIMGPNGCGKTSLLNVLSGWMSYSEGSVSVLGRDPNSCLPHELAGGGLRRSFQEGRHLVELTTTEEMAMSRLGAAVFGSDKRTLTSHTFSAMKELNRIFAEHDVDALLKNDKAVNELSGGLKKITSSLSAAYGASTICLLDEPFSGLSSRLQRAMSDYIRSRATDGIGSILADHNVELLRRTCDIVYGFRDPGMDDAIYGFFEE